jgi:phosphoglycolate phosphatase-like HAD superfamily hydrolase
MKSKAVLFDIDGTILDCSRAAGLALMEATRETFGTWGRMKMINIQGKTDPLILRESLEGMGLSENDIIQKTPGLKELYFKLLPELMQTERCRLLPGIETLIPILAAREDIILGLLTGNFRESAQIKLDRFGLFSCFAFGVYGDDGGMRNDLPPVARVRIRDIFGLDISFDRMVIIGIRFTMSVVRNIQARSPSPWGPAGRRQRTFLPRNRITSSKRWRIAADSSPPWNPSDI